MTQQLRIPFAIDFTGGVSNSSDPNEIDEMNVVTLIGTQPGERCMRPTYGVATRSLLFEAADSILVSTIMTDIRNAAATYAPEITVLDVFTDSGGPGQYQFGSIRVSVSYTVTGGRLSQVSNPATATVVVGG